MRKLIMKMSMSLDGFVSTPKEDSAWIFKSSDPESKAWAIELSRDADLLIMGRKSYEGWATYWPTATGPFTPLMNDTPKIVFTKTGFKKAPITSTSPAATSWAEARVVEGNLAEEIVRLKREPGKNIYAAGGAGFMRSLMAANLIDEYNLAIHPIMLGAGLKMFPDLEAPRDLKLISSRFFSGGIVVNTYQPA